ncbi:MAG: 4-hydroxybutyrate dehydrogenase [Planctomycetota bacterium]|nr:4-hydroxybutyrate dehydrogenase [Planctomycetota bacterium]
MKLLQLKTTLHQFDDCADFAKEFDIGAEDLILTNEFIYQPHFGALGLGADVLYQEKYGAGEPSDEMAEAIHANMKGNYRRIIAIGGGTVIDLAKIFALKNVLPVADLFDRKLDIVKDKGLVLVPTTCGTGSEVTNISILELKDRHVKLGLAVDELYADAAVLIPRLAEGLPFRFFAASSIDALIHAVESSVSPKANVYTKLFGHRAVRMIVAGYREIAEKGPEARLPLLGDFLVASNFAGAAFGNAGAGAVHAMSYPLGGKYHVAHGEANYALFNKVFERYLAQKRDGAIAEIGTVLADALACDLVDAFRDLEKLLAEILVRKPLREYGVTREDLRIFTDNVMTRQGRLMANNFVPLDTADVMAIYEELY